MRIIPCETQTYTFIILAVHLIYLLHYQCCTMLRESYSDHLFLFISLRVTPASIYSALLADHFNLRFSFSGKSFYSNFSSRFFRSLFLFRLS